MFCCAVPAEVPQHYDSSDSSSSFGDRSVVMKTIAQMAGEMGGATPTAIPIDPTVFRDVAAPTAPFTQPQSQQQPQLQQQLRPQHSPGNTTSQPSAFTPVQQQVLIAAADAALKITLGNTKSDAVNNENQPWTKSLEVPEQQVTVYQSNVPGNSLIRHKGVCIFPDLTPEEIAGFVFNHEKRLSWDKGLLKLKVLHVADLSTVRNDGNTILKKYCVRHFVGAPRGPVSSRDFVDVSLLQTMDDGSIVHAEVSLDPKNYFGNFPETSEAIRGFKFASGWYLQRCGPGGKDTKVSAVIHLDIKGWFPASVINGLIGGSFGSFFGDLKVAMKNNGVGRRQ